MSKRDYRKKLQKKAIHKAELKQRLVRQQNWVSDYDLELQEEKNCRNWLYNDLKECCLNEYYWKYKSYIQKDYIDAVTAERKTETIMHPLLLRGIELFHGKKCGWFEKKAIAHLLQIAKKSHILEGKNADKVLNGIYNLGFYKFYWIRNPDLWEVPDVSDEKQFFSLVSHLLVKYQMPEFFFKVWYSIEESEKFYLDWFVNIGKGENFRIQKNLPIPLTKKMAHFSMTAPYFSTLNQAIRWGQVMSMGGNEQIARGVIDTNLGRNFQNDDFWQTVIRFFIDNAMLDTNHYQAIYDYICEQKYRDRGYVYEDGVARHLGVAQPNFSMKNREPNTLMTLINRWHAELAARRSNGEIHRDTSWASCGIPGFSQKDKEDIYTIRELLTSQELWLEGKEMHHCVYSYENSCVTGRSAIYSLTYTNPAGSEKKATIEIIPRDKKIIQIRGTCNSVVSAEDSKIIRAWAKTAGIEK